MTEQSPRKGDDEGFNKIVGAEKLQPLNELTDLSVSPDISATLKRLRWYGVVEIKLPKELEGKDGEFLEDIIEAHLKGREAMPVVEDTTVRTVFSVHDQSDSTLGDIYDFAVGLTRFFELDEQSIIQSRVFYLDDSEYDHLAPDNRFPFPDL